MIADISNLTLRTGTESGTIVVQYHNETNPECKEAGFVQIALVPLGPTSKVSIPYEHLHWITDALLEMRTILESPRTMSVSLSTI